MKIGDITAPINDIDHACIIDEPVDSFSIIRKRAALDLIKDRPLYICDLTDVIKKHLIWKKYLPRVLPFYAVKCNDSPMVLKTLAALGTGFDCASKGEIKKVVDLGVSTSRIIFANPTKPKSHVSYAAAVDVNIMTFDCEIELRKIKSLHPDAQLVLRIRCDAKVAQCPLGEKFGCDPIIEAPGLIEAAFNLGLNVIGISFHVGSGCMDLPIYGKAIYVARTLFDFAETIGYHFHLLDIGGGFPGDKNTDIKEVAEIINSALSTHFPSSDDVTIIAEPGRFYVSSAYTLACQIESKKEISRNGTIQNTMYFINDGVYGSFNCILYDHQIIKPIPLKDHDGDPVYKSTIWGPTCDALDQVCQTVLLPKMEIDDIIVFENMGAYTLPIASPFNGFPLPSVDYFIEKEYIQNLFVPSNDNDTLHNNDFIGYYN